MLVAWVQLNACFGLPLLLAGLMMPRFLRRAAPANPVGGQRWIWASLAILCGGGISRFARNAGGVANPWLAGALAPFAYFPLVLFVLLGRAERSGVRWLLAARVSAAAGVSVGAAVVAWLAGRQADLFSPRVPLTLDYAAVAALQLVLTAAEEFAFRGFLLGEVMGRFSAKSRGLVVATAVSTASRLIETPLPGISVFAMSTLLLAELVRHWAAWRTQQFSVAVMTTALYRLMGMGV